MLVSANLDELPARTCSEKRSSELKDNVLIGLLDVLHTIVVLCPSACDAVEPAPGLDLLRVLFWDVLFYKPASGADFDESRVAKLPKAKLASTRSAAFRTLVSVCSRPSAFKRLVGDLATVLATATKPTTFKYSIARERKSATGYVGIKNLGCICYMNAMLQQFFMIPQFRYGILTVDVDALAAAQSGVAPLWGVRVVVRDPTPCGCVSLCVCARARVGRQRIWRSSGSCRPCSASSP